MERKPEYVYKKWGNGMYDFYIDAKHVANVSDDEIAEILILSTGAKKVNLVPDASLKDK
jgi:hypothetical protein